MLARSIFAFMEAADESKRQGGLPVTLESVLAKARAAAGAKESPPWGGLVMSTAVIERDVFGETVDGRQVDRFTLRNPQGMMMRVLTYGATVTELLVPDREGRPVDVVLGFDTLRQYETESPYFGCVIGRVAFRIAGAEFELDGQTVRLAANQGPHHLHGGPRSLSRVVWQAEAKPGDEPAVRFSYVSPEGDQGYPGCVRVEALHTLTRHNALRIDFTATTDRPTPVNLTHHGYFNLAGAGSGDVLGHVVQVLADQYSVMAAGGLPTGELAAVAGTRWDLRQPVAIRSRPDENGQPGFDLGYLVRPAPGPLIPVARVKEPASGRAMEVSTTEPAVVFYTGNYLDGTLRGKGGAVYGRHAGLCLEPGGLPDAVHQKAFPSIILRPGSVHRHTCVYRFCAETL